MQSDPPVSESSDEEGFDGSDALRAYLEYNKILRTWFVAFGVGGPALFLVNDQIASKLFDAGQLRAVATLFLLGVAAQIIGTLINKTANYCVYRCCLEEDRENISGFKEKIYECAEYVNSWFWLDLSFDIATTVLFGIAAWKLMTVFA